MTQRPIQATQPIQPQAAQPASNGNGFKWALLIVGLILGVMLIAMISGRSGNANPIALPSTTTTETASKPETATKTSSSNSGSSHNVAVNGNNNSNIGNTTVINIHPTTVIERKGTDTEVVKTEPGLPMPKSRSVTVTDADCEKLKKMHDATVNEWKKSMGLSD